MSSVSGNGFYICMNSFLSEYHNFLNNTITAGCYHLLRHLHCLENNVKCPFVEGVTLETSEK